MATKRKTVTITNADTIGAFREGMSKVLDHVEELVDAVSHRLWELTR